MELAKITARDQQGWKREIEFHKTKGKIHQILKKGNKTTHNIKYNEERFKQIFKPMLEAQTRIRNTENEEEKVIPEDLDIESEDKIKLVKEALNTLDEEDVELIENDNEVRKQVSSNIAPVLKALGLQPYYYQERADKAREEVLDMIYDEFGSDWFVLREFKPVYEKKYGTDTTYGARHFIQDLCPNDLQKRKISEDDEYDDGRIKFKYRLTDKVLDEIDRYGSLTSDGLQRWEKKKFLVEKEV